jgi:enediyne biosynthesis protein E4
MQKARGRLVHASVTLFVLFIGAGLGQAPRTPARKPAAREPAPKPVVRAADSMPGSYPQLVDITESTGIQFEHLSSPEQKFIVESMSGGVALIDYNRDGWPDIYFTNAQNVEMALHGKRARSVLYHNNHDGTFTDVTDKAGVGYPCWAMGASVGDYNNDAWPDLLVTCFGGIVLYRNNGDGTFTDVTKSAGLSGDSGWATTMAGSICLLRTTWISTSTIHRHSVRGKPANTWESMSSAVRAG